MQRPRARIRSPVGVPVTQADPGSRASGAPILAVNDIVKRFGDGAEALLAVDGVSFDVGEGEFVSLIGPSGCGKSTLFNIIGGLVADYDGRIEVDGESVSGTHAAFGMATSSVHGRMHSTGPKISSLAMRIDCVTFVKTVGGMK